jgi:acyl-CoA synthetase (AMP-forming)/AMP-acid ligase II
MESVYQQLLETALRYPDKSAILKGEMNISYRELASRTNAVARALIAKGIRRGDTVLVLLDDKSEVLAALLGTMRLAAAAVPLETGTVGPLHQIVKDTKASLLITSEGVLTNYPAVRDLPLHGILLFDEALKTPGTNGAENGENGEGHLPRALQPQDEDPALIFVSPGFDGGNNGVILSQRNIVASMKMLSRVMGIDSGFRELVTSGFSQPFGISRSLSLFSVGGTVVLGDEITSPERIMADFTRFGCNAFSGSGQTLSLMSMQDGELFDRFTSRVNFIELENAPPEMKDKEKLLDTYPHAQIWVRYAVAEAPFLTFLEFRSERNKMHTIGRPFPPVEIAIQDETGKTLSRGRTGEIAVRGDCIAAGYWQSNQVRQLRTRNDQWINTGEIGFIDRHGFLHTRGRKEDIIHRGTTSILPSEIEEKIRRAYPDCEIYVIGIPDPTGDLGEIPVLCYRSANGTMINPSEFSRTLPRGFNKNMIPRIVYRIDSFPGLESRVSRSELRRRILDRAEFQKPGDNAPTERSNETF